MKWRRAAACRCADGRAARSGWEHRALQPRRVLREGSCSAGSRGWAHVAVARMALLAVPQSRARVAVLDGPAGLDGRVTGRREDRRRGGPKRTDGGPAARQETRQAWLES